MREVAIYTFFNLMWIHMFYLGRRGTIAIIYIYILVLALYRIISCSCCIVFILKISIQMRYVKCFCSNMEIQVLKKWVGSCRVNLSVVLFLGHFVFM